jgi:hypothetical protein
VPRSIPPLTLGVLPRLIPGRDSVFRFPAGADKFGNRPSAEPEPTPQRITEGASTQASTPRLCSTFKLPQRLTILL